MNKTMGQIIRRLRKERNMTQEELAEAIGVTPQAISKWELSVGAPDISQIIPIATVFGVSTDVLFSFEQKDYTKEINDIIISAREFCKEEANLKNCRLWRNKLLEGLKRFPTNPLLLMACMESGICLAYPKNQMYDKENGKTIYEETVKQQKLLEKYSNNTNHIMRSNMIVVLLHSAYGNFDAANEEANKFPIRCDMTNNCMRAYIAEFEQDYKKAVISCQTGIFYHFEALFDSFSKLCEAYYMLKDYDAAEEILSIGLDIISLVCKNEPNIPPFHRRNNGGDFYCLLAQVYLTKGDEEKALDMLERLVDYDLNIIESYCLKTPIYKDIKLPIRPDKKRITKELKLKLNNSAFNCLKNNIRYINLLEKAKIALGDI